MKPFEQVVADHGSLVWRVCRAVVGPDAAEDAWSETFLAALRAYPALDPATNLTAWLITIAHRKAIDQHRGPRTVPIDGVADPPARDGIPGTRDIDLAVALAALPPKQRQSVAYHYLGGLPYAEIAMILGTTEAAARRAAADGVRTLRATYGGDR